MSTKPEAPDTHTYSHVDLRDSKNITRLVGLMEYMGNHPSSTRLYTTTRGPIQQGHRVLDIGCGTAFDAPTLSMLVGSSGNVICVDQSEAMIAYATEHRGRTPRVSFETGDVRNLRFLTGFFDVVRCIRVLHHLGEGEPTKAIGEMVRVLKPGGKLVIAEPAWTRFGFNGSQDGAGAAVRAEIMADFARHDLADNLPYLMGQLGLRPVVTHPVVRQVDNIEDFDRFYGLVRALEALRAKKQPVPGLDRWEQAAREASTLRRFNATLPIPVVIGTKR